MTRFPKAYHHMLNNSTKHISIFLPTLLTSSSITMKQDLKIQGQLCLIGAYDHGEPDLKMIMEEDEETTSSSSFNGSDLSSSSSFCSSSSDSLDDDASSPTSSLPNQTLFDLSDLMSNLPIKTGLSKFYQGKSQSFTSLASVTSLEDLAKKVNDGGYSRRLKACKSYGGGMNLNSKQRSKHISSPKSTISKKSSSYKGMVKHGKPLLSSVQI